MVGVIYRKGRNYRTSSTYFSSYPPVYHSRTISKKHPSTSRLRANACSFGRMKEVLFYSSWNRKLTHTVQLWSRNQCLALRSCLSSASFTSPLFQACSLGIRRQFPLFLPNFHSTATVCTSSNPPSTPWDTSLSKKLEFGPLIEWNGWSISTMHMTASLPLFKVHKIQQLISNLQQQPCRKNLEKPFMGHIPCSPCSFFIQISLHDLFAICN